MSVNADHNESNSFRPNAELFRFGARAFLRKFVCVLPHQSMGGDQAMVVASGIEDGISDIIKIYFERKYHLWKTNLYKTNTRC